MFKLDLFDAAAVGGTPAGAPKEVTNTSTSTSKESDVVYGLPDETSAEEQGTESSTDVKDTSEESRRKAYKEFMSENKDLFQEEVDGIINKKFKESRGLEEKLNALNPMLNMLAEKYNVDSKDVDGLVEAFVNDDSQYRDIAESEGLTLEQAKKMRELENFKKAQIEAENRQNANATYQDWMKQAEEMAEIYPEFDIHEESENSDFIKVLQNGFTVQQAYELTHPEAQIQRLKREVSSKIASNMEARQSRVAENGTSAGKREDRRTDVTKFTAEDRMRAVKQSMRNGSGSVRFS